MNYYYDILLNFQDVYCMFYEWDSTDSIDFVKKTPLFHVDNKVYKDILTKKIKVNKEFLERIEDKTKLKQNNSLKYSCIFGDGKNAIGVEFNEDGEVLYKSSVLLEDEININEFMYSIDLIKLDYEVISTDAKRCETRQDEKIKRILKVEINSMYENKNKSKLKYIYLEWFNKLSDDYDEMYENMLKKLDGKLTKKEYEIYNLIKMTLNV